ncbi:MAG: nitrite/sulfite reductase [Roseburia sp.]|nr:nitrite/sulfite reductase [Roseburia sp.]MCM1280164.1 nitrite/sulfite reductase [Robinsoniella sp.]
MTEQLYQEFKEDLEQFQKVTAGFYKGEVTTAEYKGISGGFGSYAQRGGKNSMLRLRLAGGRINQEQLKFIAEAVKEYQIDKIHFTTCQTIQLHNLNEEAVCRIMEQAFEVGIITRGGGGDFPRNVMVSPLSGVEEGEPFDVLPFAQKAADYLLSLIKTVKLPRKLKVAFSNSKDNIVHATFRDLGFVATENQTFDVYSAGGLGNNYKMGVLVAQDVEPQKVLYYIKAMVDTFTEYGNYQQRNKARTRYMQEALGGPKQYKKAYEEKLQRAFETENLNIKVEEKTITKAGQENTIPEAGAGRVTRQKQTGLCAVHYHPIGGCIPPETLQALYLAVKDMEQVELALSPDESIYILNLNGEEVETILDITKDSAKNRLEASVACIGSAICQIGLQDSQGLLKAIVEAAGKEGFADGVLPKLHISGCISSCGTHQIGSMGFHGFVKRVDDKPQPAFNLFVGGNAERKEERFGESLGSMLAEDIPEFLVELGKTIAASDTPVYEVWYERHPEELREIAGRYINK